MNIGENIAKYRRKAGLTQEQLGDIVGVSGQAVSKWENGGVPDTFLLPAIAAAFNVTTDALFGIQKRPRDMEKEEILSVLHDYCLANCREQDFFGFLFELLWCTQSAYMGSESLIPLDTVIDKNAGNEQITSQIISNYGTTYLSLVKGFPLYCAVKDSDEISEKLKSETEFNGLFGLLASEAGRKAVFFTQTDTDTNQYTAQGMAEAADIPREEFEALLPALVKYGLIAEDSLSLDGKQIRVYRKWLANPEVRPLLMLAYQFIHARQCYYNFTSNRNKAYL